MVKLTYWTRHSDSATMAHRTKAHFIVTALLSAVIDGAVQQIRTIRTNQTAAVMWSVHDPLVHSPVDSETGVATQTRASSFIQVY